MGCCCSREQNPYNCDSDANEDSPLIVPINSEPQDRTVISSSPLLMSFQRSNENDVLTKILHQTATAFINISVMDGGIIYQQDRRTKAAKYSERLDGFLSNISIPSNPTHLPVGVANPLPVLMAPISASDVDMLSALSAELSSAVETMRIQPASDLCIGF